jgi:hypothetical protein
MRVYLWGFRKDAVQHWPREFEPVLTTGIPSEAPVVVHRDAVEPFQQAVTALQRPGERRPDAILYLPPGTEVPQGAWSYFDATVTEGDWQTLRELVSSPEQFQLAELAYEVPVTFLDTLDRPVTELTPEDFPLPAEARHALKASQPGWQAFLHTLDERLWVWQQLWRPAPSSPLEHPWEHWLEIPLRVGERLRAGMDRLEQVLAAFVGGCREVGLRPIEAVELRALGTAWTPTSSASGTAQADELRVLLADLRLGKPHRLRRPPRAITLAWDPGTETLTLRRLRGERQRRVTHFRIELRHGDTLLWGQDSEQEKVSVPLLELERAVQQGAKLYLLTPE